MSISNSRNLYLDFLRGLFVCVMTINHMAFGHSWLDYITGGGRMWFSAAEGFVLISGIIFGLVNKRYLLELGWERTISKVARRAMQLFLIAVIWQVIAIALAYGLGWGIKKGDSFFQAIQFALFQVGDILGGVDLLPMYSLLLLWGLIMLYWLEKRKPLLVVVFSLGLWYARLLAPAAFSFFGQNFNPASWQVLFVIGLLGGYYQKQLHSFRAQLPGSRWVWILTLWLVSAGLWYLSWQVVFRDFQLFSSWFPFGVTFFDKLFLGPGRILISVLIFISFYEATILFWKFLSKGLGWLMLLLGRYALIAYVVQASLSYSRLFLPGFPFEELHNVVRCLMQVTGLLLTWLLTKLIVSTKSSWRRNRNLRAA